MKKLLIAVIALACAGALLAKDPAPAAAPAKPAAAPAKAAAVAAPAKAAAKPVDDAEEAGVFIDSTRADRDDRDDAVEKEDAPVYEGYGVPGGIPSSFGQCRGVMQDGGRNMLVFESLEDGTVSFVQVTFGKTGPSWKLVGRIPRSAE